MIRIVTAVVFFLLVFGVSSCTKGVCNEGFEGSKCNVEQRTKFLGVYNADADCESGGASDLTINITAYSLNVRTIRISEPTIPISIIATVDASNHFSIDDESIGNGQSMSGEGTIDGNVITLNYIVSDSNTCSALLLRQ